MVKERSLRRSHSSAIAVRLIAFVLAAVAVLAIFGTLVAAGVGHITSQAALLMIGGAAIIVFIAAFAVQTVDPMRH